MTIRRVSLSALLVIALSTAMAAEAAECTYIPITCDQSVKNRIENSGCELSNGQPMVMYTIDVVAGTVLDIFLQSNEFAPLLVIYEGSDSAPLIYDRGTSIAYVQLDAQRSGRYRIAAADDNEGGHGLFELSVFCDIVCAPPFSNSSSVSLTASRGESLTLSFPADGTPPLRYRWYDLANPGVTLGTTVGFFNTPPLFASTNFGVVISNDCGEITRTAAFVTVADCTPAAIAQQPASVQVPYGGTTQLTVGATGSGTLHYDWYEGVPPNTNQRILGQNGPTLELTDVRKDASYWVRVANTCGLQDSVAVTVDVLNPRRRATHH
jgi:hypothetical protein